tara:strand:- start:589 stop:2328 length:1740 start_codon:yes stop_codon:yes gene_type:complete
MNYIKNFLELIKKTFIILSLYKKKFLIFFILLLSIFSSLFEILTIGSLLPLIDIILNSSKYLNNEYLLAIINYFNLDQSQINLFIIVSFGILLFFSYLFRIFLTCLNSYVINDARLELDRNIFSKTLDKDYKYLIDTNSSVFLGNMEKSDLANGAVFSLISFISSIVLIIPIIILILYLNYKVALFFGVTVFIVYVLLIFGIKNKIKNISSILSKATNLKYKNILECNDNIKEIKIRNLNNFFLDKISVPFLSLRNARIGSEIINTIPSQIIIFSTGIVILIAIYFFSTQENGLSDNIQVLAAIIFAAQRMLPSIQNIYVSFVSLKEVEHPLNDITKILQSNLIDEKIINFDKVNVNNFIEIKKLSFKHKENLEFIFENLYAKFEKNKIYYLSGTSGIGKTTFFDLLIGLLSPIKGEFYSDSNKFDAYRNSYWQSKICHIPQNSLLTDASILENVAYGLDLKQINMEGVKNAFKIAEIENLIKNSENGFNTIIGDRGLKISGGERQRLTIAKAIYANKDIYLFDEATNAIDEETEMKIYENLRNTLKNKIIILISHNDKVQQICDHVYEIKNKKIEILK